MVKTDEQDTKVSTFKIWKDGVEIKLETAFTVVDAWIADKEAYNQACECGYDINLRIKAVVI